MQLEKVAGARHTRAYRLCERVPNALVRVCDLEGSLRLHAEAMKGGWERLEIKQSAGARLKQATAEGQGSERFRWYRQVWRLLGCRACGGRMMTHGLVSWVDMEGLFLTEEMGGGRMSSSLERWNVKSLRMSNRQFSIQQQREVEPGMRPSRVLGHSARR